MRRDLVEQAMAGDHDAFSELARAAIARLYAAAQLILRDPVASEDAIQETPPCPKRMRRRRGFRSSTSLEGRSRPSTSAPT